MREKRDISRRLQKRIWNLEDQVRDLEAKPGAHADKRLPKLKNILAGIIGAIELHRYAHEVMAEAEALKRAKAAAS